MSLHQPQIASIQFKCTFKLHHPFAFPLSKTREEPYVFGINARTIRGFVKYVIAIYSWMPALFYFQFFVFLLFQHTLLCNVILTRFFMYFHFFFDVLLVTLNCLQLTQELQNCS